MRVARQQIGAGADWVKIFGSTGSGEDVSGFQTFTFDEMRAAVEVAHNLGKRVAIHSYGPSGGRDAVRAGADSLEHAVDLDDETLAEMVRRKTFYVPTIDHNRYYAENGDKFGYAAGYADRLNLFVQRNLETARRAFKAGVRLAMGSDAVYSMFGQNTRELGWFVKAGMTPAQALATATTIPAALLGHAADLGAIAPGYFADLVAVDGDPLADIDVVISKVRWVMKAGTIVVDKTGGSGRPGGSGAVSTAADDIKALVERFLLHLGDHEVDKVAADLAPKALIVISRERDGQWTNTQQSSDDWIAAMRRSTTPTIFREPLTNVTVTIDSDHLAFVRADFQVLRDGKAVSHGVDQFTLVREPSGWKFAVIAYTSIPVQ